MVQTQSLEEALQEVLDEDEDMEGMHLTRRHLSGPGDEWEHEEAEMLLESYARPRDRGAI